MSIEQTDFSNLRSWNEAVGRCFGSLAVRPLAQGFRAGLRRQDWGGLVLTQVDSTPVCVQGQPLAASHGCYVLLNLQGHTMVQQAGAQAMLEPGDVSVLLQDAPFQLKCSEQHRMQVLTLSALDGRSAVDAHVARRHTPQQGVLISAFMAQLAQGGALLAQDIGQRMALDILALCWPQSRQEVGVSTYQAWVRQLQSQVAASLDDLDLNTQSLGRMLGISPRFVQLVFARYGSTPAAYIQEQRLLLAAQLLRASDARIGDIAFEVGFGDISHFCRCFRRRFGCSAREWRQTY